jgi:hypothetical protein
MAEVGPAMLRARWKAVDTLVPCLRYGCGCDRPDKPCAA